MTYLEPVVLATTTRYGVFTPPRPAPSRNPARFAFQPECHAPPSLQLVDPVEAASQVSRLAKVVLELAAMQAERVSRTGWVHSFLKMIYV